MSSTPHPSYAQILRRHASERASAPALTFGEHMQLKREGAIPGPAAALRWRAPPPSAAPGRS